MAGKRRSARIPDPVAAELRRRLQEALERHGLSAAEIRGAKTARWAQTMLGDYYPLTQGIAWELLTNALNVGAVSSREHYRLWKLVAKTAQPPRCGVLFPGASIPIADLIVDRLSHSGAVAAFGRKKQAVVRESVERTLRLFEAPDMDHDFAKVWHALYAALLAQSKKPHVKKCYSSIPGSFGRYDPKFGTPEDGAEGR